MYRSTRSSTLPTHPPTMQTTEWLLLLLLSLLWGGSFFFNKAVACCIYFRILSVAGATNLMLVTFLIPISALLLGYLFLDEPFQSPVLIGMGLISLGLAAIDGRLMQLCSRIGK